MRVEGATHRAADRREAMKRFELLSIIGSMVAVSITLGAVVIGSIANLRTEVRTDIAGVRTDIRALETRLAGVERRQARTEGLLEGLRDAITAQRGQDPPVRKESTAVHASHAICSA